MPSKRSICAKWMMGLVLILAGTLAVAAGASGALIEEHTYGMKAEAVIVPIFVGLATLALGGIIVYPSACYWLRRRRYRLALASEGA
jgi:fructose-specific phosphotransferase system IIC component